MAEKDEELVPTPLECSIYQDLIAYLNDKKGLFEATASILAKATPIIEARKDAEWQEKLAPPGLLEVTIGLRVGEAVKQERERIFNRVEAEFIWGQVKVLDLEKGEVEWTMRCISDEDWQALKGK